MLARNALAGIFCILATASAMAIPTITVFPEDVGFIITQSITPGNAPNGWNSTIDFVQEDDAFGSYLIEVTSDSSDIIERCTITVSTPVEGLATAQLRFSGNDDPGDIESVDSIQYIEPIPPINPEETPRFPARLDVTIILDDEAGTGRIGDEGGATRLQAHRFNQLGERPRAPRGPGGVLGHGKGYAPEAFGREGARVSAGSIGLWPVGGSPPDAALEGGSP